MRFPGAPALAWAAPRAAGARSAGAVGVWGSELRAGGREAAAEPGRGLDCWAGRPPFPGTRDPASRSPSHRPSNPRTEPVKGTRRHRAGRTSPGVATSRATARWRFWGRRDSPGAAGAVGRAADVPGVGVICRPEGRASAATVTFLQRPRAKSPMPAARPARLAAVELGREPDSPWGPRGARADRSTSWCGCYGPRRMASRFGGRS